MRLTVFALACAAMFLSGHASAQDFPDPLPERPQVDSNNVDLTSGGVQIVRTDVSIGPQGGGGLSYGEVFSVDRWRPLTLGTVRQDDNDNALFHVSAGSSSHSFTLTGSLETGTFASNSGVDTSLEYDDTNEKFTYTTPDGVVYELLESLKTAALPALAVLQKATQPNGAVTEYHYVTKSTCAATCGGTVTRSRLQSVTNSYGFQLHFDYARANDPSVQTDFGDWLKLEEVTALNRAVDWCGDTQTTCSFTKSWPTASYAHPSTSVYEVTDAFSRTTTYTYSGHSFGTRLAAIKWPGSSSDNITFTYHSSGDDLGRVATVDRGFAEWEYDYTDNSATYLTLVTHPTNLTEEIVIETATSLVTSYKNTAGKTTTYAYDADNRLESVTLPEGNSVEYDYDARGNLTQVTRKAKSGSGLSDIVTSSTYPAATDTECTSGKIRCNKPKTTTDALGETTTYTYDSTHGGLLTVTAPDPDGTGSLKSPQTRYSYVQKQARYKSGSSSFVNGPQTWVLDSVSACATGDYNTGTSACNDGNSVETITSSTWPSTSTPNNLQLAATTIEAGDSSASSTTSFTYNDFGWLEYVDGPLSGSNDKTRTIYDAGGRVVGTIGPDPDGGGSLKNVAARTSYNTLGLVIGVEQGTTTGYTDTNWTNFQSLQKVATEYDAYARPVKSISYLGSTTVIETLVQTSYDSFGREDCTALRMNRASFGSLPTSACTAATTGAFGPDRISKTGYDSAGRAFKVTNGYGTASVQDTSVTTFTDNGLVATVTDANGNKTTYTYDGFDRLKKTCYPSKTTTGQSSTTDCEENTYNADGLLTTIRPRKGSIASSGAFDISLTYDDLGRVKVRNVPGSGAGTSASEDHTFAYDNFGRITSAAHYSVTLAYTYDALGRLKKKEHNSSLPIEYAYDAAGRVTQMKYPDGWAADYEYDLLGRPETVKHSSTTLASVVYDDFGRRASVTYGNGTSQAYDFDDVSRLSELTNNLNGMSHDQTFEYDYSPASQIVERTHTNSLFDWQAGGNGTDNYTPNKLNQYSVIASVNIAHDGNGNITTDHRGRTYSYSADNRLTEVEDGSTTLDTYAYYADGMLRYATANGGARFYYDGAQEIAEYSGAWPLSSGSLVRRYVRLPGSVDEAFLMIDYAAAGCSSGCETYAHTDERGSVVATSDASGDMEDIYTYSPYGEAGIEGDAGFPFRFTGQKIVEAVGLYYYKARFYDPEVGRFLQTDPIGYGDGMNMYAYVGGDPVNAVDPLGLDTIVVTGQRKPTNNSVIPGPGPIDTAGNTLDRDIASMDTYEHIKDVIVVTGKKPKTPGSLATTAGLFLYWMTGTGPNTFYFTGDDAITQDLASSPRMAQMRCEIFKKFNDNLTGDPTLDTYTNFDGDFSFGLFGQYQSGYFEADTAGEHFVGSFRGDAYIENGNVHYGISNNSSFESFLYGVGPSWGRNLNGFLGTGLHAPMSNIWQYYTWTEPFPDGSSCRN